MSDRPFETDADRLAFVQAAGFRVQVDGREVRAIFIDEHENVELGGQLVSASQPVLQCRESDVAGVPSHAPVIVAGKNYALAHRRADGTGMMLLFLREV